MKPILMALCAATLGLSAPTISLAQGHGRGQDQCQPQDRVCLMNQGGKADHKPAPQKRAEAHKPAKGPKIGDSGHKGQPSRQAGNSRFKAPPRGQEYRVVNDRLVLVDKDTLKIVAVLGLLSALTN